MTISYAGEVPNGSSFGCFWRILLKWRGSVYKLVWRELIAYLFLYYIVNFVYRFVLNEQQQKIFNKFRLYFGQQGESIPMSFVLGFYVSLVVKRWWEQYRLLPWPDTLALFISAAIPNSSSVNNETGRLMRRNIMRYMVLAYVITLQRISLRVKRRFPTTQHLVDAGLMHESEMKIFDALNQKSPMSKYWMPLVWATNIINRARKEGLIASDHIVQTILVELSDIRRRLGGLIGYDTVCVPLVYTQVVTLVLYTYFIAALLGRQMLPNIADKNGHTETDLYFPLFTALQFVFYVGWLKVAEVLINPFGEDDDDIELNWLIDRHIKAAYMIVDEMHEEHPELLRDQYWECVVPKDLPYTVASEHYRRSEPKGSAENYKIKKEDQMYANIVTPGGKRVLVDDVYADYESVDTPMVERRKNNWLVRQLSRMGSVRSQATSYSSGGIAYNRNRLNSVYSSPESGLPLSVLQQQQQQQQQQQTQSVQQQRGTQMGQNQITSKPSLYEKFVHRKSFRAQRQLMKQNSRLNGINSIAQKPRPRIPTPDASKENIDKSDINGTTKAVILTPQSNSSATANLYPHGGNSLSGQQDTVLGTLLLSPIKEMDSSSSNNTLIPGHPTTTALAQAVLPSNMKDGLNFGMVTPMPVSSNSITTLSFPFAVTTTPADTMPTGTLNIVPIATTQMMPTIAATGSTGGSVANNFVDIAKDVITTIPVSLAIQGTPSTLTITEISNTSSLPSRDDHDGKSSNLGIGNSTNAEGPGAYLSMDRNSSVRSEEQPTTLISTATATLERNANNLTGSDTSGGNSNSLKTSSAVTKIATPTALAKRNPDPKTGEVYV